MDTNAAIRQVLRRKQIADWTRRILIVGIWGSLSYLIFGTSTVWGFVWLLPGFFVTMNLVGFATLPLYLWVRAGALDALMESFTEDQE